MNLKEFRESLKITQDLNFETQKVSQRSFPYRFVIRLRFVPSLQTKQDSRLSSKALIDRPLEDLEPCSQRIHTNAHQDFEKNLVLMYIENLEKKSGNFFDLLAVGQRTM